jgi:hypothetical protein
VLVLLADVVPLAQVNEEDNRLRTQQEQWVDDLDLIDPVSERSSWMCGCFVVEVIVSDQKGLPLMTPLCVVW